MADFVLIPGAGGAAWYWSRVADELDSRGHRVVAVELPADDETEGLQDYANAVVDTASDLRTPIVVAASLGAFTAALVAAPLKASAVALLNPMIPVAGETPGAWWENVGAVEARVEAAVQGGYSTEFELETYFLHDVPVDVLATSPEPKPQSEGPFPSVCEFDAWPARVMVITGSEDRFFPPSLQKRLANGVDPVLVPGGHLAAVSHPVEVAEVLLTLLD